MKTKFLKRNRGAAIWVLPLLALITAWAELPMLAQVTNFNSGSDGSYGPLNVTLSTNLALPANGIFNCTTITVATGATLTFTRNPLNTPVYLLATGDVNINGTVDVSGGNNSGRIPGSGGPGGFDGGYGGYGGSGFGGTGKGGDGLGPGGGKNLSVQWPGTYGTLNTTWGAGNIYGNSLIVPLIGGSGASGGDGNPGYGGGGGGGAILVSSSTRIVVNGSIQSNGGGGNYYGGSGGAVRLVAPTVTGTGFLKTPGGSSAGSGRTRIDCLDGNAVRSLTAQNSVSSRGAQMFVFPAGSPHLDIIQAAGQSITIGAGAMVNVLLPQGSSTNQTVVVQGTGFTNALPIVVVVLPSDRASTTYPALLQVTNNPATVTVPVNLAIDSTNRIMVWANY